MYKKGIIERIRISPDDKREMKILQDLEQEIECPRCYEITVLLIH
jgi:hypothetical protein